MLGFLCNVAALVTTSSFVLINTAESFILNHPTKTITSTKTHHRRNLKFHNWNPKLDKISRSKQCAIGVSNTTNSNSGSVYVIKSDDNDNTEIGRAKYETKIEGNRMTISAVELCLGDILAKFPDHNSLIHIGWKQIGANPILITNNDSNSKESSTIVPFPATSISRSSTIDPTSLITLLPSSMTYIQNEPDIIADSVASSSYTFNPSSNLLDDEEVISDPLMAVLKKEREKHQLKKEEEISDPIMAQFNKGPIFKPTPHPSYDPSYEPSHKPSDYKSLRPSLNPSNIPSYEPSRDPSIKPSHYPSYYPSYNPSTMSSQPSFSMTNDQSESDVISDSILSSSYTFDPSSNLLDDDEEVSDPLMALLKKEEEKYEVKVTPRPSTYYPTYEPSYKPSHRPSFYPSLRPSLNPSNIPSYEPSRDPSIKPSHYPSYDPSHYPSYDPTHYPSHNPPTKESDKPSTAFQAIIKDIRESLGIGPDAPFISYSPSRKVTEAPTIKPTMTPTSKPSNNNNTGNATSASLVKEEGSEEEEEEEGMSMMTILGGAGAAVMAVGPMAWKAVSGWFGGGDDGEEGDEDDDDE